jgi:hypothetical protein
MLRTIDRLVFGALKEHFPRLLERAVDGCETLLDIGCGPCSPISRFHQRFTYSVGIDAFAPSIEASKAASIHSEYRVMAVTDIEKVFPDRSFDCVLAADVIEHQHKDEGFRLIESMEHIARKRVIIFTPNGFLPQREHGGNPFQVHLSGWNVKEMRDLGYVVTGINGWKVLLGEYAHVKWRPALLWSRVSLLTQPYFETRPENAFAIMCVKEVEC